jgi:hypothetical protein
VATKTTYALFLLYMLFETDQGLRLLGAHAPQARALVFAVKGEDLMHLDRANAKFAVHADAAAQWKRLGVGSPGRFQNVELFAPRAPGSSGGLVTDVTSRPSTEVTTYGWPPLEFIRQGLLRYCFAEDEDASTQVSFIEQRVRVQLARWAWPLAGARRRRPVPARRSDLLRVLASHPAQARSPARGRRLSCSRLR